MTIQAQLADGRTLEFPDGTDPQVIRATVKRLVQASAPPETTALERAREVERRGDTGFGAVAGAAAAPEAERLEAERQAILATMTPEQRALVEETGPTGAAAVSAGRGLTTIARGVGLAEPEPPEDRAAFERLQARFPVSTLAGGVAGETAPFLLPGGAVARLPAGGARVAGATALGASEGAIISRGEGRDVGEQIASGTLGGTIAGGVELVSPRVGRFINAAFRRLGRAPEGPLLTPAGRPTPELERALEEVGTTFDELQRAGTADFENLALDPRQAARAEFLRSQGIEPTRAQVTREAADFQAQQESAKTSGRVRDRLEGQERAIFGNFQGVIDRTGGEAGLPTSPAVDVVLNKAESLDKRISGLYQAVREAAPDEKNIKFNELGKTLRGIAKSDTATQGAISSVVGELQKRGIMDKNMKVVGRIDVDTAEDIRRFMNTLWDEGNEFRNIKLREMKEALDNDVFRTAGQDIFKEARSTKAAFEKELQRAKVSKFDSRATNLVKDIMENRVDPERFVDTVVRGKKYRAEDIKQLRDYIQQGTGAGGEQAWNNLRAEVLDDIRQRSFIGPEDAQGIQALSRDKLQKAIAGIGQGKLSAIFTGEEQKFLRDMLQVAKLREPVRGTALGQGPSAQAINALNDRLSRLPVIREIISGLDIDSQGRAVIRGRPLQAPRTVIPSAISAAAISATANGEETE